MTLKTHHNRKKNSQLNLKFDEKFRFSLEFAAAKAGQTLTQFVTDAVAKSSANSGWEAFWHPSEGVREVLRLRYGTGHKTSHDDELMRFVSEHDEIFFRDMAPRVQVLDALWPQIGEYLDTWIKTRGTPDADKAAKQMRAVLAKMPKSAR